MHLLNFQRLFFKYFPSRKLMWDILFINVIQIEEFLHVYYCEVCILLNIEKFKYIPLVLVKCSNIMGSISNGTTMTN